MTTINPREAAPRSAYRPERAEVVRPVPWRTRSVGGFFLTMGGVHIGIVAADTETYRHFADRALFGFVRTGWVEVFMATPIVWGLLLAAGEILIGGVLLHGGLPARVGWLSAITFQVLLMLFGWGFLSWSIPALVVLTRGARSDWVRLGGRGRRHQL